MFKLVSVLVALAAFLPTPAVANQYAILGGILTSEATGDPLEDICVVAQSEQTREGYLYYETFTNAEGIYRLKVEPGHYRVEFVDCQGGNYLGEWFDDAASYYEATVLQLQAGSATRASASLSLGGSISGNLTDTNAEPASVCVEAFNDEHAETSWSDYEGNYQIRGLVPGDYIVSFGCRGPRVQPVGEPVEEPIGDQSDTAPPSSDIAPDQSTSSSPPPIFSEYGYLHEYFDDVTESDDATPVTVLAGIDTSGIDAELALAGGIVVDIRDPNGNPLSDICVSASNQDETSSGFGYAYYGEAVVRELVPDDYVVEIVHCGYPTWWASEFYEDAETRSEATLVSVTGGEGSFISVVLDPLPRPDAAISNIDITPVGLETDSGKIPGLGTVRDIVVDVENVGNKDATYGLLSVWVRADSDGTEQHLGDRSFESLTTGARESFDFRWNSFGSVGDATVFAHVCTSGDFNRENDLASKRTYSMVGGTGFGVRAGSSIGYDSCEYIEYPHPY